MGNTFWHLALEPLEERYTGQWLRWFRAADYHTFEYVEVIGEPLCDKIEVGAFLDVNSTMHWKAEQVKNLAALFYAGKVQDGDIFFVADMWFPIEMLKYLIQLNGIDAKIFVFLHAGTYTKEDFAAPMAYWAEYLEIGWAFAVDGIFVGTEYHKFAFVDRRLQSSGKSYDQVLRNIHVTGNPFSSKEVQAAAPDIVKRDFILFPNRFDYEKRPNLFLDLAVILKRRHPKWRFGVCTSREMFRSNQVWLCEYARALELGGIVEIHEGLSKTDYYRLLAEAKVMVSTTIEENFGYCTLEAMALGTIPVVPNDYSHPEVVGFNSSWLYTGLDDALVKIEEAMTGPTKSFGRARERLEYYDSSLQRIVDICCGANLFR